MIRFAVAICWAGSAFAQTDRLVSAGLIGGVPLLDAFTSSPGPSCSGSYCAWYPSTKRYTMGAAVEFRLAGKLGLETDVLYNRLDYSFFLNQAGPHGQSSITLGNTSANRWEIPLLMKYRFPIRHARLFLAGGAAVDSVGGVHQSVSTPGVSYTTRNTTSDLERAAAFGLTFGAGIEGRMGPLRVVPQVRYSVWYQSNFHSGSAFQSNANEATFLLALLF